jgi:acyl dehydratase
MVALFLCGAVALAQLESGQIAGTVMDQSGAVVTNAAVAVKNLDTNAERNTVSSSTGAFLVPGLTPGHYLVTVTSASFKPYIAKAEVAVGAHVTIDVKLSVSSSVTQVQVVAEGGVEVNTQTQELSQVIDTQQLQQLPSLTRNPYDFVGLSGNVSSGDNTSSSGGSGQNLTNRGVGYAINGQRESGTEILLDGVENIAVFSEGVGEDVPVDAVQEYSVITNNYSAEFGRASGGVVNVTTKAGTNKFHGGVWDFNRLSAATSNSYGNDAANWAAAQQDLPTSPKGTYTRNQYGFQVAGPVWKDKLFFEATTEWTKVRSAAVENEEIFDPAFIALLPANTKAYFGTYGTGAVPSSGVAATWGQLETTAFGNPQLNGDTQIPAATPVFDKVTFHAPFDAGGGVPQNTYAMIGRADYNPTDKTQMFFRMGRESIVEQNGAASYSAYPADDIGDTSLNQSYLYSLSHTFSTNMFGSLKTSFTRYNNANSFDTSLTYSPNLMFVAPTDLYSGGLIQMPGLENYSEPGEGGLPYGGPQNTIQIEPDISWTKGKHSIRFGGLYTYIQMNVAYGAYSQAVEQLGATGAASMADLVNSVDDPGGSTLVAFDARVNPQGKYPCVAMPSFWQTNANADLNQTAGCTVTPPLSAANPARSYRYNDFAFYLQDSYRYTPKLTLNYGLRWEHYGVQHNNKANLDSNFYFGSGQGIEEQTRSGQMFIADQSPVHGFWKARWGTMAPRVGFAYDVNGNGKTSVRGGFGISYERNFGNVTFNASFNPPASAVLSSVCPPADATCAVLVTNNDLGPLGLSGGPAAPLPPAELRMPDPEIEVAQTQFWSFGVQHQITPSTVAQATYSGAHSIHLYDVENINELGAGQAYLGDPYTFGGDCSTTIPAGGTVPPPCLNRPNDQYSNINMRGSMGSGSYQSLLLGIQSQNIHGTGLDIVANYTWSHSLDDLSSTFGDSLQGGSGYIGSLGYTSLLDPKLDWGSSDYDIRQRLTVSPIWAMPWFKTGSFIEKEVLGGWTISGIGTIRTGIPFSVYDYNDVYNGYTVPRLTPSSPVTNYKVGTPQVIDPIVAPNQYAALTIPSPIANGPGGTELPFNTTLGISDFGPFPAAMTRRNSFRGPGAWNVDMALDKKFPITSGVGMEFRAEGFDVLNHHNYYVNTTTLDYSGPSTPMQVIEEKGGLGSLATGGNHDERRFLQFSLKLFF